MVSGTIFSIQKYSIHDGPGIRTTVFLKGCDLRCWWCHNPESFNKKKEIIFWENKCIGCRDCEKICELEAIEFKDEGFYRNKKKCNLCGKCADTCPSEALEHIGREMTITEVIKEIEKDKVFYEESGGGVTFSGGEPLLQIDFLDNVITSLKEKGTHVVIDTSGYVPWENFERIRDKVDLFLYDIKHMDNEYHKRFTGVSNNRILSNLKRLSLIGSNIWVRVPIIPGINDDDLNILSICEYLLTINLRDVYLLPYHNIANHKYEKLGISYKLLDIMPPKDEDIKRIYNIFRDQGFNVNIGG